jgi:hypothetical protein
VKKHVEIGGRKVRTVRRIVQYIPLEFFQKRSGNVRGFVFPEPPRFSNKLIKIRVKDRHGFNIQLFYSEEFSFSAKLHRASQNIPL